MKRVILTRKMPQEETVCPVAGIRPGANPRGVTPPGYMTGFTSALNIAKE